MERESSLGGRLRRLMEEEGLSYEQMGELSLIHISEPTRP